MRFESWSDAFERILHTVQTELAHEDEPTQYREYRKRCAAWKREHGLLLTATDVAALAGDLDRP